MLSYELLFWLILGALSLLTTAMLGIIYALVEGERKNKSKAMERAVVSVARECPHFFGYLAEQPGNQPMPSECFGCPLASGCKQAVTMEIMIRRKKR